MQRLSKGYRTFEVFNVILFLLLSLIMAYPLYNVIVTSFLTLAEQNSSVITLWPQNPVLKNYQFLIIDGRIGQAFYITIITTLIGTFLSMLFTLMLAYGLSKSFLPLGKFIHRLLLMTLFIDSGLIPFYILTRSLGLTNTIWSSIIPGLISLWNYLIIRSFFKQLPLEMEEAALIDGAGWMTVFVRVVLPLSMPVIATFILYYAVDYWNTWYNAMIFNQDVRLQTLQLYVYRIVTQADLQYSETAKILNQGIYGASVNAEGVKAAACTAAVLPIILVYPFLQKYFMKGVMLGAIKG